MKAVGVVLATITFIALTIVGISRCDRKPDVKEEAMLTQLKTVDDLIALFPKTAREIEEKTKRYIEQLRTAIDNIIAIPADERTYENTAQALDYLSLSNLNSFGAVCAILKEVSPDEAIRKAAQKALQEISEAEIDLLSSNVELYKAFAAYAQGNAKKENLCSNRN